MGSKAKDILSKDEVNELLDDSDEQNSNAIDGSNIEAVDFTKIHNENFANYQGIKSINELFILGASKTLANFLRRKATVKTTNISLINYDKYTESLEKGTVLNVATLKTLNSVALVNLNSKFLFHCVSLLFGGDISKKDKSGNHFGKMDSKISQHLTNLFMEALKHAWKNISEFNFEINQTTINPNVINAITPDENLLVSEYEIEISGMKYFAHICLQRTMLDPLKETIRTGGKKTADQFEELMWQDNLKDELLLAPITLVAAYPETTITLQKLLTLKPGDVIPIADPETITISAKKVKLFQASSGTASGARVAKIIEKLNE